MSTQKQKTTVGPLMASVLVLIAMSIGTGWAVAESAVRCSLGGEPCTGPDDDNDGTPNACDLCPGFDDALDADGDGIPNGCDACAAGAGTGDADADGDRNSDDFARLAACLGGPLAGLGDGCECFDFGPDSHVDLRDARRFLNSFSLGPGCVIGGIFHETGKRDAFPRNCRVCRPDENETGWSLVDEGAICNAGSGDLCDPAERCDGVTGMCPQDVISSSETVCNPGSGDLCDVDEYCTGVADEPCPTDRVAPEGLLCRAGSGDICDPPERCNGVANETCPDDLLAPQGFICNEGAGDVCDPHERCSGNPGQSCPDDRVAAEGTVCNEGSGDLCDPDEVCSGVADEACPEDRVRASDFVCRPSGGECDVEELCTGNPDDGCPENVKLGAETVCREAAGICDAEEVCDGVHNACPTDLLYSSEQVCRAAGVTIEPDGTIVIDGDGLCDVPEYCTGKSVNCPPDRLRPRDALCRDLTGPCDNIREFCTESSGKHCPSDQASSTRLCRLPAGPCDVPEFCEGGLFGSYPNCPPDEFESAGTLCRDFGPSGPFPNFRACDVQEFCDGNSANCPENEFLPIGTECERNDGGTGECQDVGEPRPKCVEAGTVADGGACNADFECASENCVETLDRTFLCGAANLFGLGDPCDGREFFFEGDPDGRSCRNDGGDQLWCCKNGLPATTGEVGTCSECCRNDDSRGGTGKGVVGCESNNTRTECCNGRCADLTSDPYNCGDCGINCFDGIDVCKLDVLQCYGGNPDFPQPGECQYTYPCDVGDICWDSCIACGITDTCSTCQSVATCLDRDDFYIQAESKFLCEYCNDDSECGDGLFCMSACGDESDLAYAVICVEGGYCVEEVGDCVAP